MTPKLRGVIPSTGHIPHTTRRILPLREAIDAATAIARAGLDAGCDFFAGYPIPPRRLSYCT